MNFSEPVCLVRAPVDGGFSCVAFSPNGEDMAFAFNAHQQPRSSIGIKKRDGGVASVLVRAGFRESGCRRDDQFYDIQFTPDGKKLLYCLCKDDYLEHSIWTVEIAGGVQTCLRALEGPTHPCLSPDGTQIVFNLWKQGVDTLHRMTVEGADDIPLTDLISSKRDSNPVYSPDGRLIVFISTEATASLQKNYLCTIRPDGTERKRPAAFSGACSNTIWHPGSGQIVFNVDSELDPRTRNERCFWRYRTGIYRINADGTNLRCLVDTNSVNRVGGFSPEGRFLVFSTSGNERFAEPKRHWDIRMLEIETGEIYRVTDNDRYNSSPCFTPEGDAIIFASEDSGVCGLYQTRITF